MSTPDVEPDIPKPNRRRRTSEDGLAPSPRELRAQAGPSLDAAAALQRSWMPPERLIRAGRLELAGSCEQAGPCGGDFWDARPIDGGELLLVLGDATGHELDAALLTGVAKGVIDLCCRIMEPRPIGCSALLQALNIAMCDAGAGRMFMTCTVAAINPKTGAMRLASAGHPLPYVVLPARSDSAVELNQLPAYGPRLGESPEHVYDEHTYQLRRGEIVLWHTDGVVEREDTERRQYGHRSLRNLLRRAGGSSAAELRDWLSTSLRDFAAGAPPVDDQAFVFARFGRRDITK